MLGSERHGLHLKQQSIPGDTTSRWFGSRYGKHKTFIQGIGLLHHKSRKFEVRGRFGFKDNKSKFHSEGRLLVTRIVFQMELFDVKRIIPCYFTYLDLVNMMHKKIFFHLGFNKHDKVI